MPADFSSIPSSDERYLSLSLGLAQYPILAGRIREKMRQILFARGLLFHQPFESQVRELALRSQQREGVFHPYEDESPEIWELRTQRMRDQLTDLQFSHFFTFNDFEKIVNEVMAERGISEQSYLFTMNPELAPLESVFEQAMTIQRMEGAEKQKYAHRLEELKVVLIRALISDQLKYINIAKEWFNIEDLLKIRRHRIGAGRIGGKTAGMLLAHRILQTALNLPPEITLDTPDSYFIGSQEIYTFMTINNLAHWNDQKYKTDEEMRKEFPLIEEDFKKGDFPPDIALRLEGILATVGKKPLIVRSSSLLEDNFGTSFAGKYESFFLPNQGSPAENLKDLKQAIARVYASVLNPNPLLYRRSKGLLDYDERMAILLQVVEGEQFGNYYMPHAAGVAFSHNTFRWSPQLKVEDGFVRLVWGLGTRAVDREGNEYPRLVALSHPLLRPSTKPDMIHRYSQQYVDAINLETNSLDTLAVHDVIQQDYLPLRYLFQSYEDGYLTSLQSNILPKDIRKLTLTFDEFIKRTPFADTMRKILTTLESIYHSPVDMEFTIHLEPNPQGAPGMRFTILQCRPQSYLVSAERVPFPSDLPVNKLLFSTRFVVPLGNVENIEYVVFVPHEKYYELKSLDRRQQLANLIGKVNAALAEKVFICLGPGRWGSSNSDLGVPISYGDIYHTRALVELTGPGIGPKPEPSLGTHFFQDLLEAQIFPLAIELDNPTSVFNHAFFYKTPNHLTDFVEAEDYLKDSLRVIRCEDFMPGHRIQLIMNDEMGQALAFFKPIEKPSA